MVKRIKYDDDRHWIMAARFLDGKATEREQSQIKAWLETDGTAGKLMEAIKDQKSKTQNMDKHDYDVDGAWEKLKSRIGTDRNLSIVHRRERKKAGAPLRFTYLMRSAAMIVVLLGVAWLLAGRFQPLLTLFNPSMTFIGEPDSEKTVFLPEGSGVTLNAGSRLVYVNRKSKGTRETYLRGEAYFEVEHNRNKPFIVHAGNAVVRVVGTTFNINEDDEEGSVEVSVVKGLVEMAPKHGSRAPVKIGAGYTGRLGKGGLTTFRSRDDNLLSWKTKDLIFRETSLRDVALVLERTYHRKVRFSQESIGSLRFTGDFSGQPADTVMEVLSTAFGLRYEKQGDTILFSKKE